jgi:hypothetical protein
VFSGARLGRARFDLAALTGAAFDEAHLLNASFAAAELRDARLDAALLSGASFEDTDLVGASLEAADWNEPRSLIGARAYRAKAATGRAIRRLIGQLEADRRAALWIQRVAAWSMLVVLAGSILSLGVAVLRNGPDSLAASALTSAAAVLGGILAVLATGYVVAGDRQTRLSEKVVDARRAMWALRTGAVVTAEPDSRSRRHQTSD